MSPLRTALVGTALAACLALAGLGFASAAQADDVEPQPRRFTRVSAPDGIQIRRFNKTDGRMPGKKDRVVVHYEGRLRDGTVFDTTYRRGRPAPFKMDKVIACWREALSRLRVGERAEIRCPAKTAYGSKGQPPDIPPGEPLRFEVELVGIQ